VCFDKTDYSVSLYKFSDNKGCPDGSVQLIVGPYAFDDACSELTDDIKNLQDLASCRSAQNCGVDTGAPAGEPGTDAANVNVASLAFIVSLVCLLLNF